MLRKNHKVDLKLKYHRVFEISLILALFILIGAFKFSPNLKTESMPQIYDNEIITVLDIVPTIQDTEPPIPPKPIIPIEVPNDIDEPDVEIFTTEFNIDENMLPLAPPKYEDEETLDPTIFVAVEEMPEIIGGLAGLQSKIVYPEIARRAGVSGKVFLQALIDESGNVIDVKIIKGIGAGCDEAAIKALKETKFRPGKQRGKEVKVQMSVPVVFSLQ